MADDYIRWEIVPKGTSPSTCKGEDCGAMIYWVERQRMGKKGMVRVPVDCSVEGGAEPDSLQPGKGVLHFRTCPNAGEF